MGTYSHIELTRSHIPPSSSSSEEQRITYMPWRSLKIVRPRSALRSITKAGSGRALVPMSATSNLVPMGRSSAILFEQHWRKWHTRIGICFCFSENTGILAIAMQAWLSGWMGTRRHKSPSRCCGCMPARDILQMLHNILPPLRIA